MTDETLKKRVLFLFTHLHKGGMQRAVSNISLALPASFEQYVGFFGTENPPFEYRAIIHDFNVPGGQEIGIISRLRNYLLRIYKLRKFIKKQRIDVVVSFGDSANILNVLSFHSVYRVVSVRSATSGYADTVFYSRIYQRIIRFLYPFADEIVTVSQDLKKRAISLTKNKVPVRQIPNLYHLDKIKHLSKEPLPQELTYLNDSPFILNVGALIRSKGQDLLIKSFVDISERFPNFFLVLIGRGEEKKEFIALAQQLKISDRVVFIDFDVNPYRFMRLAKVFVLPSHTEGFPNVLVEAMACDCPVIAFDCPTGPREIIGESEYGELIESISVSALSERVQSLLLSPKRLEYLKEQSMKRAANFDAGFVVSQWVDVLSRGEMLNE